MEGGRWLGTSVDWVLRRFRVMGCGWSWPVFEGSLARASSPLTARLALAIPERCRNILESHGCLRGL